MNDWEEWKNCRWVPSPQSKRMSSRSVSSAIALADRSFVGQMLKEESDAIIVESIIGLAHNLGLRVIAEGVEDQDSWQRLADLRCDSAQGLLISPGLPIEALVSWHARWIAPKLVARGGDKDLPRAS